jgi:hypothetical protein
MIQLATEQPVSEHDPLDGTDRPEGEGVGMMKNPPADAPLTVGI